MAGWMLVAAVTASCRKAPPPPPPAVPVSVDTVRRSDVPVLIHATGTVEPIQTAAVQAQVSGQLVHVRFTEGDPVTEGQVLFEIDPRPFQAALSLAQGPLSSHHSQWESAVRDLQRYEALLAKDYVTQQQVDQQRAMVTALVGMMRSDSASIEQARLNLQYATIHSPISGRAGSVLVKEGNQVRGGVGQTLVVINQISPILIRFPVPSVNFEAVRRRASQSLLVHATPVGDTVASETGSLVFLDNAVDSNTGTVLLKASFPNRSGTLWPGALPAVSLQLDVMKGVLVVPAAAVQTGQSGSVIWVVDSAKRAHVIKVTVLQNSDSLSVLAGGVTPGQRVVTDGQLKLTDGARVAIRGEDRVANSADSGGANVLDTGSQTGRKAPGMGDTAGGVNVPGSRGSKKGSR